jgi:Spy/CpxP family protein refolding chaperone
MKNSKIFLSVAVLSFGVMTSFAQTDSKTVTPTPATMEKEVTGKPRQESKAANPEARAKMLTDKMAKDYMLTEDQKTKVYEINLASATAVDANKPATGTTPTEEERKAMMKKRVEIENKRKTDLETVLTPEQLEKFKADRNARIPQGAKDNMKEKQMKNEAAPAPVIEEKK